MATYTLYNRPGSGGFAVEAALTLANQPFDFIDVGSQPGEELDGSFRATNPWGQVPALILPDGTLMTETGAICVFRAHPDTDSDFVRTSIPIASGHDSGVSGQGYLG